MLSRPLNQREAFVVERLYSGQRWSVPRIARVLGLGRRLIENCLKRQGVTLARGRPVWEEAALTDDAARAWFLNERDFDDESPPFKETKEGPAFRRRRCWKCQRLLAYRVRCGCGARLNAPPVEDEVADLREEEENRG